MADIFLSYANEDREMARAVAGLLESAGCTVWWDRRIPAGRTWRSMIEEALRDMRCMVVLWSTHSVDSDWVKEEAEEARALGKLIPVLIEPVKPPVGFRSIQAADLTDWDGSKESIGARQLIADLESLMGKPRPRRFSEANETPRKNRPITDSIAEETPVVERSVISNETATSAGITAAQQIGWTSIESNRKPVAGWKTITIGTCIVVAVLGSALLWFGKEHQRTWEPEIATISEPAPPTAKPARPPAPSLVSLDLSGDRQEIRANETLDFTLKGRYSDGTEKNVHQGVTWASSDPRIATIDTEGRVTGHESGQTTITARYGDLVSPAWTLAVRAERPVLPVTVPAEKPAVKTPLATQLVALTVSPTSRELKIQERLSLRVKARYSDGNEKGVSGGVEWRSSDISIASVNSRGELVALRPGKTVVVARWGGIESLAVDIVVRESLIKPLPEPPAYYKPAVEPRRPAVEPRQETPSKPPVPTINIGSYVNRAKSYRVQGNYAAALTELEKAHAISPGSQELIDEIDATRRACNAEKRLGREDLTC
jgi:TIR domain/Bacterial Ig-like domain (group 2)